MKKTKWITHAELTKNVLADPQVKRLYDELEPEYALVRAVLDQRLSKKISQAELSRRVGTKQSAISRLESGDSHPSLKFLQKVATALDATLRISFE